MENTQDQTTPSTPKCRDLPAWLYWGGPIATLLICWLTPLLGYGRWHRIMGHHEFSFIEIATVVFLLPASVLSAVISFRLWRRHNKSQKQARTVALTMFVLALAAFYLGGEEMSWGQSYIRWGTPDSWKSVNKQNETNIHNLELTRYGPWIAWLDDMVNNTPRQALLVASILGATLPLMLGKWRRNEQARKSIWYWLIPTRSLVPICALAATSTLPEKVVKLLRDTYGQQFWPAQDTYVRMAFLAPAGELKEYCYGMMILLYAISLYLRTRNQTIGKLPE